MNKEEGKGRSGHREESNLFSFRGREYEDLGTGKEKKKKKRKAS